MLYSQHPVRWWWGWGQSLLKPCQVLMALRIEFVLLGQFTGPHGPPPVQPSLPSLYSLLFHPLKPFLSALNAPHVGWSLLLPGISQVPDPTHSSTNYHLLFFRMQLRCHLLQKIFLAPTLIANLQAPLLCFCICLRPSH